MKGCAIIPSFNESKIIYDLVKRIKMLNLSVVVVDDGSRDKTADLARKAGAEVISHSKNLGKGVSLRTGFQKVIKEDYEFIITMDGDGQHRPEDLEKFISLFSSNSTDIIVGNRMDEPKNMPFHRWITNKIMSMIISSICKIYIPDTQCGFRLIKTSVLKDIVFSTSNYEIESELLIQGSKKNYSIQSVPIKTVYEGQDSQINPVVDTIRFFKFILKDQLKEGWFILKSFFDDTVIKHGSIMFLASLLSNVFSLAFWLFMVRKLHHIDYGILNSMVSFLSIASLPTAILQTVLARYFSEFKALDRKEKIQVLFRAFLKRIIILNSLIAVIFFFLSRNIADFLHLDSQIFVYFTVLAIFFNGLLTLTGSALQGMQLFPRIALNSIFNGFMKLASGIILVLTGFKALGAFLGFVLSAVSTFILSLFQLPSWILRMNKKEYSRYKPEIRLTDIYSYFFPVSIALIAYTLVTNSDIILVKHFFSESSAGIYSIAQTVGKIILFLPGALSIVFFPISVQRKAQNKEVLPLLKKSLFFVATLCTVGVLFTLVFPRFVLNVVSGKALPECVPLVRLIIFPMSLFALNYIFIFYNLSINNIRFIISIFIIAVMQIISIAIFHNSLFEVILILFISALLTFYLGLKSIKVKEKS